MNSKGIRILDKNERVVSVNLPDILEEIQDGSSYYWSILFLDSMGHLGEGQSIPVFQDKIYNLEKGLFISWEELNILSKKFYQIFDITLIGCKDKDRLQRYEEDQVMYETCDIVIEMIDSSYWEIFSNDNDLIDRLAAKFKDIEFLEPDYER